MTKNKYKCKRMHKMSYLWISCGQKYSVRMSSMHLHIVSKILAMQIIGSGTNCKKYRLMTTNVKNIGSRKKCKKYWLTTIIVKNIGSIFGSYIFS